MRSNQDNVHKPSRLETVMIALALSIFALACLMAALVVVLV